MKQIFQLMFLIVLLLLATLKTSAQDLSNTFHSRLSSETLKNAPVKLIPYPQEVTWGSGLIAITNINISDFDALPVSIKKLLQQLFNESTVSKETSDFSLKFIQNNYLEDEGYSLEVSDKGIEIQYKQKAGWYYALQTLKQLTTLKNGQTHIQSCVIKDAPKYAIRGFMLDVGRNFVSLDVLKAQLDIMAQYKLNVFQWHLTDRPAWRIESKAYPQLTEAKNHRPTRNPGKFYTYDDIRELITYAKERQITVIPEIDMPGHSDAFTTAMGFAMHSENGMAALENILIEFFAEIPVNMCPTIHLGSDEVHIDNPKAFMDKMIGICHKYQRDVMVWNPGLEITHDVIRQTWQSKHIEGKGYREIDSWNSYINNSEPMTAVPKLLFKPIGYQSENKVLGGILSLWPDVRLEKETDFINQNPLYPALLTYAWATWTADIEKSSDRYLTMLPSKDTEGYDYFSAFEDYVLHHKQLYFKDLPFPYTAQVKQEWKLSEPLSKEAALLLEETILNNKNLDTTSWKSAIGNTIIIKDRFKQGGYYPEAEVGKTVFAISTIEAEADIKIKTWIGFETPLRANRTYTGIAQEGQWDANGGAVWVNGKALPAPKWKNPGWKPSNQSGWGTKEDQELPWADEELYWTRKPVEIALKKGTNTMVFKVPSTTEYQNWMFTFAPLEAGTTTQVSNPYSEHYYSRKALFEASPDTENEIIFLGNSITEGGRWEALFPNHNVINRGISGDVTDGILNRLDEITSSQPQKIFLMVGTNDMARGKSIAYVLKHTKAIIETIQKQSKNTTIYLQSILPINPNVGHKFSGHKSNHQNIIDTNIQLKELAKSFTIQFIDLHKAMRDKNNHLKAKYTYDGLHLSDAGYVKWKKEINKYLK